MSYLIKYDRIEIEYVGTMELGDMSPKRFLIGGMRVVGYHHMSENRNDSIGFSIYLNVDQMKRVMEVIKETEPMAKRLIEREFFKEQSDEK